MKKSILNICTISLLSLALLGGCKEDDLTPIKTLDTERAFSATGLTATVINKINVRLTWAKVASAASYTIEIFNNADFTGTPVKTISAVTFDKLPYTVTDLSGDTQYYVRVKSISNSGAADSKWVSVGFKTDAEQIFNPVNLADITAKTAVLTWTAGATATSITVQPGNITHVLTPTEITQGKATITGLTGETTYTARLLNGAGVRGTITFTTAIDLGDAIAVSPTDDLATKIANAPAGAVLALLPGTYNVVADLTINKNISIKGARPADRPVIVGAVFRVKTNAGLTFKDLILDGTGALNNNQTIIYDEASDNAYGVLNIEDCLIKNYVKGFMYVNLKTLIETINIRGNIFNNIECNGGDFLDFRNGITKALNFTNNTVYASVAARDFIRMDAGGSTNFPTINCIITVATNTLNGVVNGTSNRLFYVRIATHQIIFSKNIVANSGGIVANQAATNIVAANFTANNYYNAPAFMSGSTATSPKYDTGTFTTLNPGFTNVATGNFTISNIDLKTNGIGDPRWRQ